MYSSIICIFFSFVWRFLFWSLAGVENLRLNGGLKFLNESYCFSSEPEAIKITKNIIENKPGEISNIAIKKDEYDKSTRENTDEVFTKNETDDSRIVDKSDIVKMEESDQSVNVINSDESKEFNNTDENLSIQSIDGNMLESIKSIPKTPNLLVTTEKTMSPKQFQRKIESEKKKQQKQQEKEEREQKKLKLHQEKMKMKQEKEEQKKMEIEQKQKEKELKEEHKKKEKESKRKEKEEREEQKRKEREAEKIKKQLELDEKNKEKQKLEEKMQKSKVAFANFFVTKKTENMDEKKSDLILETCAFMPFEVKSDMRLAPISRIFLSNTEKNRLFEFLEEQTCKNYLQELKNGKSIGKAKRTWQLDDLSEDIMIVEETDLGESIVQQKPKLEKVRAKFLKFTENQRPAYFGTWRKKSKSINPRRPFKKDSDYLNYEIDSDQEWEEEDEGESLKGSDDEEKEAESENEYEVDNEFFVPHGHLSDDEVDDEEDAKLSPESHKAKLKLLKNEFEEERKSKTQKIKPRLIGCLWYVKEKGIDEVIEKYLQPFAILHNGPVIIKSRDDPVFQTPLRQKDKYLNKDLIPDFLRLIHGNKNKGKILIKEFIEYLNSKNITCNVSKASLSKQLKQFAQWMKCPEKGIVNNKYCWYVTESIRKQYNMNFPLPNQWKYISKDLQETI